MLWVGAGPGTPLHLLWGPTGHVTCRCFQGPGVTAGGAQVLSSPSGRWLCLLSVRTRWALGAGNPHGRLAEPPGTEDPRGPEGPFALPVSDGCFQKETRSLNRAQPPAETQVTFPHSGFLLALTAWCHSPTPSRCVCSSGARGPRPASQCPQVLALSTHAARHRGGHSAPSRGPRPPRPGVGAGGPWAGDLGCPGGWAVGPWAGQLPAHWSLHADQP